MDALEPTPGPSPQDTWGYGISPKGSHAICSYVRVALWAPSAQSATAPTPRTGKAEGNGETDLDLRLSGGELAASDSSRGTLVAAVRGVEVGGNDYLCRYAGTLGSNSHVDLGDPTGPRGQRNLALLCYADRNSWPCRLDRL